MQTLLKLDAIKARMKAASDALRVISCHVYWSSNWTGVLICVVPFPAHVVRPSRLGRPRLMGKAARLWDLSKGKFNTSNQVKNIVTDWTSTDAQRPIRAHRRSWINWLECQLLQLLQLGYWVKHLFGVYIQKLYQPVWYGILEFNFNVPLDTV